MELDRALELAVLSSWGQLVTSGESCSIHLEYKNVSELPLNSMEVWMMRKRGYGTFVCNYSTSRSDSPKAPAEAPGMHFANSYGSQTLHDNLDFIMRNQRQFTRHPGRSIHGLVQIDPRSAEERIDAATWRRAISAGAVHGIGV
jgi:hypothetical protein